jgi:hypothetical protein
LSETKNLTRDVHGVVAWGTRFHIVAKDTSSLQTFSVVEGKVPFVDGVELDYVENGWDYNHQFVFRNQTRFASRTIVPWKTSRIPSHLNYIVDFESTEIDNKNTIQIKLMDTVTTKLTAGFLWFYSQTEEVGNYGTEIFKNRVYFKYDLQEMYKANRLTSSYPLRIRSENYVMSLGVLESCILIELMSGIHPISLFNYWIGVEYEFLPLQEGNMIKNIKKIKHGSYLMSNTINNLTKSKDLRFILPVLGQIAIENGVKPSEYSLFSAELRREISDDLKRNRFPLDDSKYTSLDYLDLLFEKSIDLGENIPSSILITLLQMAKTDSVFRLIDWTVRSCLVNQISMSELLLANMLIADGTSLDHSELRNINTV